MKKHCFCKIVSIVLLLVLGVLSLTSCSSSEKIKLPAKANDEQVKLINYIVEKGEPIDTENSYMISGEYMENDVRYSTSITYDGEKAELYFNDMSTISNGNTTIALMKYSFDTSEQTVSIGFIFNNGEKMESECIIKPSTYSLANTQLYSYKTTIKNDTAKKISELSVLRLLMHTQSLMSNAGISLKAFGFKNGISDNTEQIELINYITTNGKYSEEQDFYYIEKKFNQDKGSYITAIAYSPKTTAFTFTEMYSDSRMDGTTLTSLKYLFGKKEQDVLFDMMSEGDSFRATGTINIDTYSHKNTKIHSYKATDAHNEFTIVAEYSVLSLFEHAQSILKDIGFSLEIFGFKI